MDSEVYKKFKKLVLGLFEGGFLKEENPQERKSFVELDEVDALILHHFETSDSREEAEKTDDELSDLFSRWLRHDKSYYPCTNTP